VRLHLGWRDWRRLASRLGLFDVSSKLTVRDGEGYEVTLESKDMPIEELVGLSMNISFKPPPDESCEPPEGYQ